MRILLQFPEGLKQKALEEAAKLEAQGHEVILSGAACFGACDLALDEARAIGANKLLHFGHAEFSKVRVPGLRIEYAPYFAELDWKEAGKAVDKAIKLLQEASAKKISLVFPVQHIKNGERVKARLADAGFAVLVGRGGNHIRFPGQVLGCDGSAAFSGKAKDADAVVYFGGGKFHPTGIPVGKPVLACDPHLNDSYWITDEMVRIEKKRRGSLLAASQAKCFGILVSTKCGQANLSGAMLAKRLLEKKGRRVAVLAANEFSPIALANFLSFDAYVNTACPRISDDCEAYGKPLVNVSDIRRLLELMV